MIVLLVINIRNYYKARFNMDLALLSISMIFIMHSYYNEPKWDFRFELLFGIIPTGYNNNMFRKYRALHPELN